jgi:hypothetical protein
VLVVAADDGVMPQTLKLSTMRAASSDHRRGQQIDKPDALPDRVKKQLAWLDAGSVGCTTVFVDVSAKRNQLESADGNDLSSRGPARFEGST